MPRSLRPAWTINQDHVFKIIPAKMNGWDLYRDTHVEDSKVIGMSPVRSEHAHTLRLGVLSGTL